MTKEDYMKLSKERLAELLAERDEIRPAPIIPQIPFNTPTTYPHCPYGGICYNPRRDCVGCPYNRIGVTWRTFTNTATDENQTKR